MSEATLTNYLLLIYCHLSDHGSEFMRTFEIYATIAQIFIPCTLDALWSARCVSQIFSMARYIITTDTEIPTKQVF